MLNALDLITTTIGLNYLGHTEDPGSRLFQGRVTWLDVVLKMSIAALICFALYQLYLFSLDDDSPIAERVIALTLGLGNLYYLYVLIRNIWILWQLLGQLLG